MKRKVILLGAGGQLGQAVVEKCGQEVELYAYTRHDLDITDFPALKKTTGEKQPAVIINCAAYTAVDNAERDEQAAFDINAAGVSNIGLAAGRQTRIIQVSTDFVFSGPSDRPFTPEDPAHPVCVYGMSKYAGEKELFKTHPDNSVVVRTSWLYSAHGKNFLTTMLGLMRQQKTLRVVSDQLGSPTSVETLAEVILRLSTWPDSVSGIFHWSDRGVISWYDFAVAIRDIGLELGLLEKAVSIQPVPTSEYPTPARRPVYSALDATTTEHLLGITTRPWRGQLERVMRRIKEQQNQ